MKKILATKAIRNMLLSAIVLIPLQLNTEILPSGNLGGKNSEAVKAQEEIPPSAEPRVVLLDLEGKYYSIESFLKEKKETIDFLSKAFGIESAHIYDNLTGVNEKYIYDRNNIGRLKDKNGNLKEFSSFEKGFIEYLFDFASKNPQLVSSKITPYNGKPDYIIDLIKYFTSIYNNVDYLTAVSIGAAESGYYKVKYMLNYNNVFGGMGKNGLIKYKNIEYGVLSYIRLLSKNYYGKGLDTLESIGRVYCPVIDESGNKIASSHWISLVKSAKNKYEKSYSIITIDNLISD